MNEQTRYRVTGAVFLLAIAIIVLPMVFDGEGVRVKQLPELAMPLPPAPSDAQLSALKIPEATLDLHREEMEAAAELVDADGFDKADNTKLGDPALREVIALAEPETSNDSTPSGKSATVAELLEPQETNRAAAKTAAQKVSAKLPVKASVAEKLTRTAPPVKMPRSTKSLANRAIWAVQLASFASPVNATALRDRLLKDGFEAWTSTAKAGNSVRTRVAIGPLLDRRDAERMRDLVSGRYKMSAIVVHMEP